MNFYFTYRVVINRMLSKCQVYSHNKKIMIWGNYQLTLSIVFVVRFDV